MTNRKPAPGSDLDHLEGEVYQRQNQLASRMVGEGDVSVVEVLRHPQNFRTHPEAQKDALRSLLSEVGWVARVTINRRTGLLIDGHCRLEIATEDGEATIPAQFVDLSPDEEALVLATFDPIGQMAGIAAVAYDELLREVGTGAPALQELLDKTARDAGLYLEEASKADDEDAADEAADSQDEPGADYCCPSCGHEWSGAPR